MEKKVMIFGVFDGLHDGHRFFIEEAQKYGNTLYIVVTPDEMVKRMKDHRPNYPLFDRMKSLANEYPKANIVVGDEHRFSWNVVKENKPDTIVLGYDQGKLGKALGNIQAEYDFELTKIKADHHGNKFHSSLIQSPL